MAVQQPPAEVRVDSGHDHDHDHHDHGRPAKRARTVVQDAEEVDAPVAVPPHPLGIRPAGNAYTATVNLKDAAGGFARLPDELLIQLLDYLDAPALLALGGTCKALYAFCRAEELWKALFIESSPKDFQWRGTWRSTYFSLPPTKVSQISCDGLYSDVLYRPFFCAHTPLDQYAADIPARNAIPRLADLTAAEFEADWTDRPFILTEPVKQWPIYGRWTPAALRRRYPDVSIRAEAVDWPLATYIAYMNDSRDESPLYLFDSRFAEKFGVATSHAEAAETSPDRPLAYWPPSCFGPDYLSHLGPYRPDHRWLILGPSRSGSTFHQDPNATSAWNAVLTGAKYWLMFPGPHPPPGVLLSPDHAEITAPLSIPEYLLAFHALARATPGCREAICHAGELLHVPAGWFHLVLNVGPDASLALTQNFVPRPRVPDVLRFCRDRPDQVSGFADELPASPYELLRDRLREACPEVLEEAEERLRARDGRGRWESIVRGDVDAEGEQGGGGGGFSFGFGADDDEEVEVP